MSQLGAVSYHDLRKFGSLLHLSKSQKGGRGVHCTDTLSIYTEVQEDPPKYEGYIQTKEILAAM